MPIYEYTCRACGEDTEKLQKLSDPDWVDCPACGKPELQRTVSAAGFRLSGSGWYETDFKQDGKRNLANSSDSSSGSGGSPPSASDNASKAGNKSDSKSDSKPSDKSAAKTSEKKTKSTD